MSRARRATRHHRLPLLLAGTVIAASLLCLAAVGFVTSGDDDAERPVRPAGTSTPTPTEAPVPVLASPTPSRTLAATAIACRSEISNAEAVVAAARVAAGHWREQVLARYDLLTGKATEATVTAILTRTKLAAPADLKRLAAASAARLSTRGRCDAVQGPSGVACRRRMGAIDAAATAGRNAVGDWQRQLASEAQQIWRAASRNLNAFAAADAVLARTVACNPA